MFTGIVKEIGRILKIEKQPGMYKLELEAGGIAEKAGVGDSVSVNGVCLTVTGKKDGVLSFDIVEETARKTAVSGLVPRDAVNLERALAAGEPFGGHFVTGHIDCAGEITDVKREDGGATVEIIFPGEFTAFVVQKGSIAIDGVSLTIAETEGNALKVCLVPHTQKATTLGSKKRGDSVNLEFDIIGKYILKAQEKTGRPRITEDFLKSRGFV
jgi:riboflavin synthase